MLAVLGARLARAETAADICPPAVDPCIVTTTRSVTPGSTLDFGGRALVIRAPGRITVSGGPLAILAGSLTIEPNGELIGTGGDTGSNLAITTTGNIHIQGSGNTNGKLDTSANVSPGQIDLTAGGSVDIDGFVLGNGSSSDGGGAVVNITAGGDVTFDGSVKLKGGAYNLGGFLSVVAEDITVTGLVDCTAADGGLVDFDARGDVTVTASGEMNLRANGGFGDGGELTLIAHDNVNIAGQLLGQGAGSYLEGGGFGSDVLLIAETGSITISGNISIPSGPPDGDGGELDVDTAVDLTTTGILSMFGNGIDSCGGGLFASAGRRISLGANVLAAGGSCGGGYIFADAVEQATLSSLIDANGDGFGGLVSINAGLLTVSGRIQADSTTASGIGGSITLDACDLTVPAGGVVRANGVNGLNLLRAGAQLTIAGQLSAIPGGVNRLLYRNAAQPPLLAGASIIPVPIVLQDGSLPACAAAAVCGNGVEESGEECDDGNAAPCDGCSAACRDESCGNRVIECAEECDNGPGNGTPGNPCDATCHVVDTGSVLLKPGKRRGQTGCMLEWALRNPNGEVQDGFPTSKQSCVDGDPTCDGDGANDGGCSFRVAACLAPIDPRLPDCQPQAIASANLRRPNPVNPRNAVDAANAQALVGAFASLGITVLSRDTVLQSGIPNPTRGACSDEVDLSVPHPAGTLGRRLLRAGAEDVGGRKLKGNRLALICLANSAVCGNGTTEIGEVCDDGNTASCDGCSASCRVEVCGNGVVDCGEDCDNGAANGTPGSTCTASCTEAPPSLRIPGGARATECVHEWGLAIGAPTLARNGLPHTKQSCVDGDPVCDFDPTPGTCRFHVWSCLAGADARIGCLPEAVSAIDVVRPSATQTGFPAVARAEMLGAYGRLTPPLGPGEVCSERLDLEVPVGKKRLSVRVGATGGGAVDRDPLKLTCLPALP